MKNFISIYFAIWLSAIGLLPHMDTHDIAKLPNLLDHYSHHLHESGNELSFLSYLSDHLSPHTDAEHDEEHEDLPFHNHCCSTTYFIISEPLTFSTHAIAGQPLKPSIYRQVCYTDYHSSIFLPPKI